jgi:hypothetical protein
MRFSGLNVLEELLEKLYETLRNCKIFVKSIEESTIKFQWKKHQRETWTGNLSKN